MAGCASQNTLQKFAGARIALSFKMSGSRRQYETTSGSTIQAMKIRYFTDTDTVYIEFREAAVVETRDLGEDAIADLDAA